jgi:hypothetical protein
MQVTHAVDRTLLRTSVIVCWYLIYPTVSRQAVRVLDCSVPINDVTYLVDDFSEACWTSKVRVCVYMYIAGV